MTTHGLRPTPVQRECCCSMQARPWQTHEPSCDRAYRALFFARVRALRAIQTQNPWGQ